MTFAQKSNILDNSVALEGRVLLSASAVAGVSGDQQIETMTQITETDSSGNQRIVASDVGTPQTTRMTSADGTTEVTTSRSQSSSPSGAGFAEAEIQTSQSQSTSTTPNRTAPASPSGAAMPGSNSTSGPQSSVGLGSDQPAVSQNPMGSQGSDPAVTMVSQRSMGGTPGAPSSGTAQGSAQERLNSLFNTTTRSQQVAGQLSQLIDAVNAAGPEAFVSSSSGVLESLSSGASALTQLATEIQSGVFQFDPGRAMAPAQAGPTGAPASSPTAGPTGAPASSPTAGPTGAPASSPSAGPTGAPASSPSAGPTGAPASSPSAGPTGAPASSPSAGPTGAPASTQDVSTFVESVNTSLLQLISRLDNSLQQVLATGTAARQGTIDNVELMAVPALLEQIQSELAIFNQVANTALEQILQFQGSAAS